MTKAAISNSNEVSIASTTTEYLISMYVDASLSGTLINSSDTTSDDKAMFPSIITL
jgi:hypothetical protein